MSYPDHLYDLSREQLYSVINKLKRENSLLTTDLMKNKLLTNDYQNYFNYFNELNEKITSNEEILVLINKLKALKDVNKISCFVSLKTLTETDFNRKLSQVL